MNVSYFCRRFIVVYISCWMISCTHHPYTVTNKAYRKNVKILVKTIRQTPHADSLNPAPYWVGTTNFNLRKPNFVIIHHTAQNSCDQTLKTFTSVQTQVSAHYVICKDGKVHHMLNDYLRGWHGGVSKWGNLSDINSSSIGIELDNNGFEVFTDPQLNSLMNLLALLKKNHNIPAANFIGHADIAPTRKVDPNVNFPWRQFAEKGFGFWYDDTTGVTVPGYFNNLQALRIIGYDVQDSTAAIQAFKRHFLQQDNSKQLTEDDKKILYNLLKKYQ